MKINHILFFVLLFSFSSWSQNILGNWYSLDSDSNEKESIIEVYQENNKIYAKIVSLLKKDDKGKVCVKCTGNDKDKPIEGLVILKGLSKDDDEWSGGKILDPKNGSYYKCYMA